MKLDPPEPPDQHITDGAADESGNVAARVFAECWTTIGVLGGDHSCPELRSYVHCRNCPVHAEAGVRLLDRPLPTGYREEWSRRLAEKLAEAAAGKASAIIFRVGGDWLALATAVFQEVAERRVIRSLPHQRNHFVLGLVNVRGELLVCISLPRFLGLPEGTGPESAGDDGSGAVCHRLLVVGWQGQRQAFPVDEVYGVHRYQENEIVEAPALVAGSTFTRGRLNWNGRAVEVLNEETLFPTLNQTLA